MADYFDTNLPAPSLFSPDENQFQPMIDVRSIPHISSEICIQKIEYLYAKDMETEEIIIKLDKPTRASEVQMVFSKHFPFLKLEFFRKQHKALEGSPRKSMIKSDFELQLNEKTSITISDNMQVAELENLFMDKLNISAQVFRKSGRTWLETTFTDNWTLRKQNEEGLELSQF